MLSEREIADHLEITQLLYRYGWAIDTRDWDLLTAVFTPDASIDYSVERGVKLPFPEMLEWLRGALAIFRATQHSMSNPLLELDGDAARSTTYVSAAHVQERLDGSTAYALLHGIYTDRHVRTGDGWRIAERRLDNVHLVGRFLGPDQVKQF